MNIYHYVVKNYHFKMQKIYPLLCLSRINILQYGLKKYAKDFDRNMKLKSNTGSNVTSFSINVSS